MRRRLTGLGVTLVLLAGACGGDDDPSDASATSSATESESSVPSSTESSSSSSSASSSESTESSSTAAPGTDAPVVVTTAPGEGTEGILQTIHTLGAFSGSFDPAGSLGNCDAIILRPIYDSLVHQDPVTSEALPGLAESWNVVDASTAEFTLREGLTFHDGQVFDAAALKAGLEHNAAGEGSVGQVLKPLIASIEVVDDLTVRIVTTTPVAATLPLLLSGREGMIAAPGSDSATAPVGAGPQRFESTIPNQIVSLRRFEDYFDPNNKLAGVDINNSDGGPQQVSAMLAGDYDLMEITPDLIPGLEDPNVEVIRGTGGRTYVNMSMNLGVPPFNNLHFRQAVNLAVDRQAILDAAFAGEGDIAWGPYPEGFAGLDPSVTGFYDLDLDKARALLAESGLTDFSFTAVTPPYPAYQRFGQIVQQNLAEIGIEMTLEDSSQVVQDYYTDKRVEALIAIANAAPVPLDSISKRFTPGNFTNPGEYSNDELTALFEEIRSTADPAAASTLLQQASRMVVDLALDLPAVYQYKLRAFRTDRVRGEVVPFESCLGVDLTKLWVVS